jgi:hypothetical protein
VVTSRHCDGRESGGEVGGRRTREEKKWWKKKWVGNGGPIEGKKGEGQRIETESFGGKEDWRIMIMK